MPSFSHQRKGKPVRIGNQPVRFTIFGGGDNAKQVRMLASNPWRCMELALRAEKRSAQDSLAYLRQAHDFHIAAEAAKATARPLLMYYSFLNLAKMLVKHRNPGKDLTHASHGISEAPQNTERQRVTLTAQAVRVQKAFAGYVPVLREFATAIGWKPLPAKSRHKVCDLLAQVPAIHRPYSRTRGKPERLYLIDDAEFRYDHSTKSAWAILWVRKSDFHDTKALAKLRARSYYSSWLRQVETDADHGNAIPFQTKACSYGRSPREKLVEIGRGSIKAGIMTILTPNGYRYYLSNFEPRIRIHQLLAAYMAMFYFGSIARYRPADFEKILQSKYGWVIEEFLVTQGHQFVYLTANLILGQEVCCPWAIRASEPRL